MTAAEAWTAGMLDGWIALRFGPAAPAVRIWAADCLAAGFTVAVYTAGTRHQLVPCVRAAAPHAVLPYAYRGTGGIMRLVAECVPDATSNVVPLPRRAAVPS